MRAEERTIGEVATFLSRWRDDYIVFLERVRDVLKGLPQRKDFRPLIHRVYTREDRQLGEKLKDAAKIAIALQKLRDKDFSKKPYHVTDIIGATIVCPYPSDIGDIIERLRPLLKREKIRVTKIKRHNRPNYVATHLIVAPQGKALMHTSCEIQLKTMLHDAWGAKTHDLTYKPIVRVNAGLQSQMEKLFNVLHSIDEQSEIIKHQILEQEVMDRMKRMATRRSLISALHKDRTARYRALLSIKAAIDRDQRAPNSIVGPDFKLNNYTPFRELQKLCDISLDQNTLRICIYLASLLDQTQLSNWAVDRIDEWGNSRGTAIERVEALRFKAVALLAIDRVGDAIRTNNEAVRLLKGARTKIPAKQFKELLRAIEMNGAYYRAEYCFVAQQSDAEYERASRKILERHFDPAAGIETPGNQLDTAGLVLVTFGRSADEIRRGMEYCRKSLQMFKPSDRLRPCAEAFVQLHERRAFKRLLEISDGNFPVTIHPAS